MNKWIHRKTSIWMIGSCAEDHFAYHCTSFNAIETLKNLDWFAIIGNCHLPLFNTCHLLVIFPFLDILSSCLCCLSDFRCLFVSFSFLILTLYSLYSVFSACVYILCETLFCLKCGRHFCSWGLIHFLWNIFLHKSSQLLCYRFLTLLFHCPSYTFQDIFNIQYLQLFACLLSHYWDFDFAMFSYQCSLSTDPQIVTFREIETIITNEKMKIKREK